METVKKEVEKKIMSSGRKRDRKNITWTVAMIKDLIACKEEALIRKASEGAPPET